MYKLFFSNKSTSHHTHHKYYVNVCPVKENKWFLDSSIQNWSTLNVDINKYNSI